MSFYRGFFKQLGEQSANRTTIALTPDHQNTLLGMLADYKKQESSLTELRAYKENSEGRAKLTVVNLRKVEKAENPQQMRNLILCKELKDEYARSHKIIKDLRENIKTIV